MKETFSTQRWREHYSAKWENNNGRARGALYYRGRFIRNFDVVIRYGAFQVSIGNSGHNITFSTGE